LQQPGETSLRASAMRAILDKKHAWNRASAIRQGID
jgi:hypothetical protein